MTVAIGRRAPALFGSFVAAAALLLGFLPASAPAAGAEPAASRWEQTLERVARAVVVLRVSEPRAFDTESPATATATGFVVDAERGLILTNRHVVGTGPVVAEAVFLDHEEVPVRALYRDPVHDFGFFQYDPADVGFMEPDELPLAPEAARVGTEIRVVGNDAGEKLSILAGTLARLDRAAPDYGRGRYSDFNTFYYQAASGTSGGSSGSPVVDIRGRAVALNAGGARGASSSFYLPLDKVVGALEHVRRGEPVPRGTLQTVFDHRPYDEVRRLGLRPETEAGVRRALPRETGMLVVTEVVPGGPGDGVLRPGDVLVRVGGERVTGFTPLELALDGNVGAEIELEVERGGEPLVLRPRVADLHAITPAEYLEFGGAVVHRLSYQQARNHAVPVAGLYVATPGYVLQRAGVPGGAVLTAVDGVPVASLDALEERLARIPPGGRVPVRYFELDDPRNEALAVATADHTWFPMRRCAREGPSWICHPSPAPPAPGPPTPATTTFREVAAKPARRLAPSLAMVDFHVPLRLDGVHGPSFQGTGIVVDAERGLVIVDRETAPVALGDVELTFAASVEVPGEVVYLDPIHDFAVVSYDPALLGDTPVRAAELRPESLAPGDDVWLVGMNPRFDVVARETRVSRVSAPTLPLSDPPRFRQTNAELVSLEDDEPTVGGALADGRGRVRALWAAFSYQGADGEEQSFFAGLPVQHVVDVVEFLRAGRSPARRGLGVELMQIPLAGARRLGLSAAAARDIESHDGNGRNVLAVARLTAGAPSAALFETGDLLLRVAGRPAASFLDVEEAAQAERVGVRVLRNGRELDFEVETQRLDGRGTTRCAVWAGAVLQDPHPALAAQRGIEPGGVYVAWVWFGSPAHRYGLSATRRIVELDGAPTPDLETLLAVVADRRDRDAVRLRTVDLEGVEDVVTLKLDLEFWPTTGFRREPGGWVRWEGPAPQPSPARAAGPT